MSIKNRNSNDLNIFKTISKSVEDPSFFLNLKNKERGYFFKNDTSTLYKLFDNRDAFRWELYVSYKLNDLSLPIEIINDDKLKIVYKLNKYMSLRSYIKKNKHVNLSELLNELVSFVSNLSSSFYFIHGNLNVDNIFVKKSDNESIKFYLINFTKSKFKKNRIIQSSKKYFDMNSLYYSIIEEFGNNVEIISYLDHLTNDLAINYIIDLYKAND